MAKQKLPTIEARLDLHFLTQEEAFEIIEPFLKDCYEKQIKLAIIITGKSGVLKENVGRWLEANQKFNKYIREIQTADIQHGGDGAMYIWIKKNN